MRTLLTAKQQATNVALKQLDIRASIARQDLEKVVPGLKPEVMEKLTLLLLENDYEGDIDHLKMIVLEEAKREQTS